MKKQGLTFPEHRELGKNLRTIKELSRSIHNLLSKKFGATKRYAKQAERIGVCVDRMTDDLNKVAKGMPNPPTDINNFYYKI